MTKKRKNMVKRPAKKPAKSKPTASRAPTMRVAAARMGIRYELIQAAKDSDCPAIHQDGRVNCEQLTAWLAQHPDLVESVESRPDIKAEKALRERNKRRLEEIELESALKTIAPLDMVRRIIIRAGKMLATRIMAVPDRVCERHALMTDSAAIRENLITELSSAMQSMSDEPLEKLIEEVLKDGRK